MGVAHRLPFQKKSLRIWGLSDRLARRFSALVFFPVEYFSISLIPLQGYSIRLGLLKSLQLISRHPINLCFSLSVRLVSTLITRSIPRLRNGS